jgi:alginate O-acetyltransferase complex protein AlgI
LVFSSPTFLFAFLPAVLACTFAAPRSWRNAVLLTASLGFYAWGEQELVLLMLASITGNFAFGLGVDRSASRAAARRWVGVAVAFNLALLVVFKYTGFLGANLNAGLAAAGLPAVPLPEITLPIGISFFTFQALSYVIDVYRGHAPVQRSPLRFALYIALFPQLIAGPIVRYHDLAMQLAVRRTTRAGLAYGIRRFVAGLAKKVLIANTVAEVADAVFAFDAAEITPALAWLGILCYAIQIYFDFSGYSDMAIGLGAMFGFGFLENFNYPYVARSITEFWRRWHISLSTWFRDYLYVPLGGNRGTAGRTYRNLLIVFLLCGLWHGASWSFVVWGLWHGGLLIGERVGGRRWVEALPAFLRWAYVWFAVLVGWVFFRAETLPEAVRYLGAMAGVGNPGAIHAATHHWNLAVAAALAIGFVGSAPLVPWVEARLAALRDAGGRARLLGIAADALTQIALVALLILSAMWLAAGTHNPFIYFRF